MKRDMDLVRKIMLELSESRNPLDAALFTDERHDYQDVAHHIEMMQDAGLIKAMLQPGDDCWYAAAAIDLTWEGHEFVQAAKNDKVWRKVMLEAAKHAGGVPFALLTTMLQGAMTGVV